MVDMLNSQVKAGNAALNRTVHTRHTYACTLRASNAAAHLDKLFKDALNSLIISLRTVGLIPE